MLSLYNTLWFLFKAWKTRNSLALQWLRFATFTAVAHVPFLVRELRESHVAWSKKKKKKKNKKKPGKYYLLGFPGGSVLKKPVCNAGDSGLIPGSGLTYWADTAQLLKPKHLEPVLCKERSHRSEKPTHHDWRVAADHCNWRKPAHSHEDLAPPKVKIT